LTSRQGLRCWCREIRNDVKSAILTCERSKIVMRFLLRNKERKV